MTGNKAEETYLFKLGCVRMGFPGDAGGKEHACQCRRHKRDGFDPWVEKIDPLEEGMAIHSNILSWRIPWTKNPGRLQSIESQRVGYD